MFPNDNVNVNVETRHALSLQFQFQFESRVRFKNHGKNAISQFFLDSLLTSVFSFLTVAYPTFPVRRACLRF
jgi:hypothetical protein